MRMLMTVQMDVDAASRGIQDGTLPKVMDSTLSQLQPESAYFTTHEGCRTAYIFFDLKDPSQMPRIAEPLFSGLKAKIDLSPVMNADDLRKGLSQLQQASSE
jgi:hypothetical protein